VFVALERKFLSLYEIKPGDSINDEFGMFLSKDDDLQLLNDCLCLEYSDSVQLSKALESLIPYAYNMNTMLLKCASEFIYKKMNLQYRFKKYTKQEVILNRVSSVV